MTTWQVVRGDAMRVLTEMDDDSVDAVVTDPPYSSGGAFRSDRSGSAKAKYLQTDSAAVGRLPEFYGDNRSERGLLLWSSLWLSEAWRVTRSGGAIAVFCDWRSLPTVSDAIQSGGWSWRGVGVWTKPPGKSRPVRGGLWNDSEFIVWGSKGARVDGECLPGTWTMAAPSSKTRMHPTEKPTVLLADLVRLAPPGGVVLDPFCGYASTGVACIQQGRRFFGCELSAEYVALGTGRLRAATASGADVSYGAEGLFDSAPHGRRTTP